VSDYNLTSCERVSFSQIVTLFQSDIARNESDAKQPWETEPNATADKRLKIKKGIYSFIIFLAALFTILHLGWLGPIKRLFKR